MVIEQAIEYGKIVCRFTPMPAVEMIKRELVRELNHTPRVVYQRGLAQRQAREEEVIKDIKAGKDREELLEEYLKRGKTEAITFYGPNDNLDLPYHYSRELIRLLPDFLQFLVEKLDIARVCVHLDEYQTLDFIPSDIAEHTLELKRTLIADFIATHSNQSEVKRVLKVKQGGARKRKGFVWTKTRKTAFRAAVDSLPKHKGKLAWQFLLDELIDHEFDSGMVAWLKSCPALGSLPKGIVDDAIKAWRKYLAHENWGEMKRQDRPRAFGFRHALDLLNYPDGFSYSTLERYYYQGKGVFENQTSS